MNVRLARPCFLHKPVVSYKKFPVHSKMYNILIIKPGAIGDLLHLTPLIRSIKSSHPDATISILVGSAGTAPLFKHNPHVCDTLIYDKRNKHRTISDIIGIWNEIRRRKFNLVLNFQRSNLKTWLLATAALPCHFLVYHKTRRNYVHAVDNYLETIKPLNIPITRTDLDLFVGPEDELFASQWLLSAGFTKKPVIAINPGASHPVNRWPVHQFVALLRMLEERLSANVVIVGGEQDVRLSEIIVENLASTPSVMTGKTTLLQLGALLKRCALLVTGDTGPMHIATAVGTPVVALFGAADPRRTGPIGAQNVIVRAGDIPCVPCRSRTCSNRIYQECMEHISPKMVFEAISGMLNFPK